MKGNNKPCMIIIMIIKIACMIIIIVITINYLKIKKNKKLNS